MRYLCGTSYLNLSFGENKFVLVSFTDAHLVEDIDSHKSAFGYLINIAGGAMSWQSRLQNCVTLSTIEVEFIAITKACIELLWMKKFLRELNFEQERYMSLCDNQNVIILERILLFIQKRYMSLCYHSIRMC